MEDWVERDSSHYQFCVVAGVVIIIIIIIIIITTTILRWCDF
jgi:preprotein translocase subunit SecE